MQDFGLLRCIYGFTCGALANLGWTKLQSTRFPNANIAETFALLTVAIYISFYASGVASFFAPIVFAPFIAIFAMERGAVSSFLSRAPFMHLGTVSYSIYMVHIFVAGKLFLMPAIFIQKMTGIRTVTILGGQVYLGSDLITGTMLVLAYLAVTIVVASLAYRHIERPAREWARGRRGSHRLTLQSAPT